MGGREGDKHVLSLQYLNHKNIENGLRVIYERTVHMQYYGYADRKVNLAKGWRGRP